MIMNISQPGRRQAEGGKGKDAGEGKGGGLGLHDLI